MKKAIVCGIAALALATTGAQAQVINELFISHSGTDNMEFVEICAQANEDLSGLTFVVIEGDSGSAYGTIDVAVTLGTAGPDGYYVAGNTAVANLDLDIGGSNVLENGTNTFLLVSGFSAAQGDLIDGDGDGVADFSIGTIVDGIAREDNTGGYDYTYYSQPLMVGDGNFSAAGVARCEDCTGSLDQLLCFGVSNCDLGTDGYANITPGERNECGGSTGTEEASWGTVKSMFR